MQDKTRSDYEQLLHSAFFDNLAQSRVIRLTDEADQLLKDYEKRLEDAMRPEGELRIVNDFAGKVAGRAVRVAALLALAENPKTLRVDRPHILRGIAVADYGLAHGRHIAGKTPTKSPAAVLLDHIKAGKLGTSFTLRDLIKKGWARLKDEDAAKAALAELEQRHYVRPAASDPGQAGRPTERWEVSGVLGVGVRSER
jgi:hypothetical protein